MLNVTQQLIHTDDIRQKEVSDQKRDEEENYKLQNPLLNLLCVPRHFFQKLLLVRIAINPVFNFPENHFHKNGLRTSPSTKNPSEYDGKKYDENHEGEHGNSEDEKILWPEDHSENDKPAFGNIKQQQRFAMHFDEWKCKKYCEVKDGKQSAQLV